MFFYYFFVLFMFYFFLNMVTSNVVVWWSVFIMMTLSFIFIQKIQGDFSNSLNYFLLQEFLGLLFLIFIGLLLQLFVLFMKVGVSPLHFWIFSVFSNAENYILIWFLTMQKLPFIPVLFLLMTFLLVFFVLLGVVFCYFHLFLMKNYKLMLAVSSTESFSWLLSGVYMGFWGFVFMSLYYFMNMYILVNYVLWGFSMNYTLEMTMVFLNVPLTFAFILKIFMLSMLVNFMVYFLLLLVTLMFLSSLSFLSWFVNYSVFNSSKYQDNISVTSMMVFGFFFLGYYFHFSKMYYVTLME